MELKCQLRSGTFTVRGSSNQWTHTRVEVAYDPDPGSIGEREGYLPPLDADEMKTLIKAIQFVMENHE